MQKLLPILSFSFFLLPGCQSHENTGVFNGINKTLERANETIAANNDAVYVSFNKRIEDPQTQSKVGAWRTKAIAVKSLSQEICEYIGSLKQQLATMEKDDRSGVRDLFRTEGDRLYDKLARYNNAVVRAINPEEFNDHPSLNAYLVKEIESLKTDITDRSGIASDSLMWYPANNRQWKETYLNVASLQLGMTVLNKIQNDVLVTENIVIFFMFSNTTYHEPHWDEFQAIAVLSSSYVKAGQPIEVTAGVGAFTVANKPVITINGSMVKPDDNGTAIYKLTTNQKPGKYQVPVRIEYTKPDGSTDVIIKHLEYIVAE